MYPLADSSLFGGTDVRTYIPVTFLFLGWAFYEMSGGSDFTPAQPKAANPSPEIADALSETEAPAAQDSEVLLASFEPENPTVMTDAQTRLIEAAAMALAGVDPEAPEQAEETVFAFQSLSQSTTSSATDLREVAGNRVNMRSGPGTSHGVIVTLNRGQKLVVLETNNGWARVEVVGSGRIGWMSESLLTSQ